MVAVGREGYPSQGYGTLPVEGGGQVPARTVGARRVLQGVAATCLVAALGIVALAARGVEIGAAAGRTELSVYQNKYQDVKAGGDWMQCLKCRHANKMCHPSKGSGRGRTPAVKQPPPPKLNPLPNL